MNPPKLYKGQYEFYYEPDFKGTITGIGPNKKIIFIKEILIVIFCRV